jgi:hypothetical protein
MAQRIFGAVEQAGFDKVFGQCILRALSICCAQIAA